MINYTGPNTYHASIYIISIDDPILGGQDGIDNIAIQQIAQSTNYLKKFKGNMIFGEDTPAGNYGLNVGSDTPNNTLYMDTFTGSWWKPSVSGTNLTGWTNITKDVVLNVKGLDLNKEGEDTHYSSLTYDYTRQELQVRNAHGHIIGLRLGTIAPNIIDNTNTVKMFVVDDEILLNTDIKSSLQNRNGAYAVKRFDVGNIENPTAIVWNNHFKYWEFKYLTTNGIIAINSEMYSVKGKKVNFVQNATVSNQAEFDALFMKDVLGGFTIVDDTFPRFVFITKGDYIVKNTIRIRTSNFKLECGQGAVLHPHPSVLAGIGSYMIDAPTGELGFVVS